MTGEPGRSYAFGPFLVDPEACELRRDGHLVALAPKAFATLLLLIEAGGRLLTKDELMKALWPDTFVLEANLSQTIFTIRKALGESGSEQRYIVTVPGRGYRFGGSVQQVFSPEALSPGASSPAPPAGPVVAQGDPAEVASAGRSGRHPLTIGFAIALVVLSTVLAGYARWSSRATPHQPSSGRVMLAVLPFENLTGDAAQDYFSDGLTEEMINRLGRLDPQRLGVIGRASVMRYKGRAPQLDRIGNELDVGYVLAGSVRRGSGKVRIAAQLIQVKDQTQVWASTYDRDLRDLLAVQAEIAREIANGIQIVLGNGRSPGEPVPSLSADSYEAYDLYLKGRYCWNKRTADGLQQAIEYFRRATARDPNYARAYAGLADAYALMSGYSGKPQTEFMVQARSNALKALELDDGLAEAHNSLALVLEKFDWDWEGAEQHFRRAIELDPNYSTAHQWYAEYLSLRGRFEEALLESERARRLDPFSLIIATDNGAILYFSRQYDRAIHELRGVLEIEPSFPRAHMVMMPYVEKGLYADALATVGAIWPTDSAGTWAWYTYIYGRSGQVRQARQAFVTFEELNRSQTVEPGTAAWAYLGMNRKDEAIASLEQAYAQHSDTMCRLKVEPGYDPLRSDPRFQDLVRRVGLDR
jgi:TolB-like protein/DNA-binding winged helix-turn-helix (wHTH) protein/Tfp pilus assembly protein PilF